MIRQQVPPAIINSAEKHLVQLERQVVTLQLRFRKKQIKFVLLQFWWIFVIWLAAVLGLDHAKYEDECLNQATFVYGEHPSKHTLEQDYRVLQHTFNSSYK